jgi:hypothetical protein
LLFSSYFDTRQTAGIAREPFSVRAALRIGVCKVLLHRQNFVRRFLFVACKLPCLDLFPAWVSAHLQGDEYLVPEVQALGPDDVLREILESQGIQSLVTLPLMNGTECLGFDAVRGHRSWGDEEIWLLRVLAEMLANLEIRRMATLKMKTLNEELRLARDKADAVQGLKNEFPAIQARIQNTMPFARMYAEPNLLRQAFGDLLFAVQCYVLDGEEIEINASQADGDMRITMVTTGQSLPQEALDTFFEVAGQRVLLKGGADFGLSPVLAKHIIELFKGAVSVRNGDSAGIVIDLILPIAETSRSL